MNTVAAPGFFDCFGSLTIECGRNNIHYSLSHWVIGVKIHIEIKFGTLDDLPILPAENNNN